MRRWSSLMISTGFMVFSHRWVKVLWIKGNKDSRDNAMCSHNSLLTGHPFYSRERTSLGCRRRNVVCTLFVMLNRKKGPRNGKDEGVGYRRQSQLHENLEE